MNNPTSPCYGHVFPWGRALAQIYGTTLSGTDLCGALSPASGATSSSDTSLNNWSTRSRGPFAPLFFSFGSDMSVVQRE